MAIEIKEIKMRFNVVENQDKKNRSSSKSINTIDYKNIIKECTDNVLRELERRTER